MNFLVDLNRYPDQISEEDLYELLELQLNNSPMMYEQAHLLSLGTKIPIMKAKQMATRDIIIYHPHKNNFAKENLKKETGYEFKFMTNFEEVLDLAKENSTYFLSDIDKIMTMKEKNCLKFSSITLPVDYRYNRKDMEHFKYDLEQLYKDEPHKLSYMSAFSISDKIEDELDDNKDENEENKI